MFTNIDPTYQFLNPANGHIYELNPMLLSWDAASLAAQAKSVMGVNGYLATITSQAEEDFVKSITGMKTVWLGGTDSEVEGAWKWVTGPEAGTYFWSGSRSGYGWGQPVNQNFVNWFWYEPDNWSGTENPGLADYLLLGDFSEGSNGPNGPMHWGDTSGFNNAFSSIIEYSPAQPGKITVSLGSGNDLAYSAIQQPDGKLLVAGVSAVGSSADAGLIRLNSDGTLDTSFGTDGKLLVALTAVEDIGHAVTVQSDGKIIVATASGEGGNVPWQYGLARLNTDGSLDTTFGAEGKVTFNIGSGNFSGSMGIASQMDNKLFVWGFALDNGYWETSIARLNSNGTFDTSFDGDGQLIVNLQYGDENCIALTHADGKISLVEAGSSEIISARLNSDGSYDTTFDGDGIIRSPNLLQSRESTAAAGVLQQDGKIVVTGYSYSESTWDLWVFRLNADGTLDNSFDGDGQRFLSWGGGDDFGQSAVLQNDGKIILAGFTRPGSSTGTPYGAGKLRESFQPDADFGLIRLNIDGSLDNSFGNNGKLTIPIGNAGDYAYSVLAQTDGKIVVVGSSGNGTNQDMAIVRLNSDGSLDTRFGAGLAPNNAPIGAVTISGSAKLGRNLTVTNNLADVDGLGAISYQWMADGQAISGATGSSFTLTRSLLGKSVTTVASFTDGGGTLESVTSNALQVANYNTAAAENSKTVTTLAVTDALLGTAPKYTLSGLDASLFKVSSKGVLTFAAVKDYEQPVDTNKDGVYEVSVTLTNAKTGYKVVKDLTVGVEFVPIKGTAGSDTLKGTAGWDTLDGLSGDDKLTGGAGLDTFLVTAGRDAVLDFNLLTKDATGSEVLQVSAGATADATLKAAWVATSESFNEGTANLITKGMAIDLSGITDGLGWNVTNTGAAATLKGSQFNDRLIGGSGNDTLLGGAGNDLLAGGKGLDFLTGGTAADTFRLGGDTKTDHITDFWSGNDRIELDNLVFKALLTEGQLSANQFAQGTAATTATQRIVYDQPTGNLWYDLDGSGKGKAVLIAVLDNHVQITNTDFWVI